MKTGILYEEVIGSSKVTVYHNNTVTLEDASLFDGVKSRQYQTYDDAIVAYDNTCTFAAKLHNTPRPLPDPPSFGGDILNI